MSFVLPRAGLTNTLKIFSKDAASFFSWFFFNNKREVNQKQFDHIHATSRPHTPFNVFQKWCYSADTELKRDYCIVTKLIHSITLNNALKASCCLHQAEIYIMQWASGGRNRLGNVPTVRMSLLLAQIILNQSGKSFICCDVSEWNICSA